MTTAASKKSHDPPLKRSTPRERNLSKTGLITLISIFAAAILVSRIPKFFGPDRDVYVCTTSVAHGINGIQPGSEVWFGGIPCGEVLEVKTVINPKTSMPTRLEAVFNLNRTILLRQDAQLNISTGLTGGKAVLQIIHQGQLLQAWPTNTPRFIPLNEISRGTTNAMGIRASNAISVAGEAASNLIQKGRPLLKNISETTEHIRSELQAVTTSFNESLPAWKEETLAIINARDGWANQWTDIRSLVSKMNTALQPIRELVAWTQGDGADQIQKIRSAISLIQRNGTDIQNRSSDIEQYAQATFTKGREVIDHGNQMIMNIQKTVPNLRTDYNHIRARNSLAGAQLTLLFKDILGTAITAVTTVPNDASWNRRILFESIQSVNLALESLNQTHQIIEHVLSTHSSTLTENPQILKLLTEAASRDSQAMNEELQALYQLFLRRSSK